MIYHGNTTNRDPMMSETETVAPPYRALKFLVAYGDWVAILVAAVPMFAGLSAFLMGWSFGYVVAGVAGSAFLYLIMRSYVELVRLIVDMLLPK
jgi:hypothetical protein